MGMRRSNSSSSSSVREVEDVVELMQLIQSWLPVEEAARTSVLSKSWLHAWSTIPTLRFLVSKTKHLNLVDRTLSRYLRDNIPIERFDLDIRIDNPKSASLAEKWIRSVATATTTTAKTSCPLKELNLRFFLFGASITLPDEILTVATNLTKLTVSSSRGKHSVWMKTPIINCNCVSLREVFLRNVQISQAALDAILLSCSFLAKLYLTLCCSLKSIKVINRPCLNELRINLNLGEKVDATALEISHVPNLRVFGCQLPRPTKLCCSSSLGSSVTELLLGGGALITDDSSLDMIKSALFPFLESLTLDMDSWTPGSFQFTCATLKRLSLRGCRRRFIDVQVYAPKLHFFLFGGYTMPSLLFPVSTLLNQMTLWLILDMPLLDVSFFIKMREALTLSTKCDLSITTTRNYKPSLHDIDIDDLRTRLPPAANNVVQLLEFNTTEDDCLWERSPFFDALFEVCHPNQVLAKPDVHMNFRHTNHFCKLMLTELLEKKNNNNATAYWSRDLKHVQVRRHRKWETLTKSHTSFLNESPAGCIRFRLDWR